VALWNASEGIWKHFLDITEEEIQRCVNTDIVGSFAFARAAILNFQENELSKGTDEGVEGSGKRGTLIFTGATASLRGNVLTSLFSAGKFGLRSLSQSLNKEFSKQNIHVAHVCVFRSLSLNLCR
jgi:short-subunit dehydrogenase